MSEANYIVKSNASGIVHGEFDSYDQAVALYRKLSSKDASIVIKDNSRGKR